MDRLTWVQQMRALRITQSDLAKQLGVTDRTVRNWINGENEPKLTLEQWQAFAKLLGVPFDALPDLFPSASSDPPVNPTQDSPDALPDR